MKITKEIEAIFIFLSTIIGLGVFVLPYTFLKGGFWFIFWFLFWLFSFFIIHLIFAEIIFQTKETHNLPGLAGIYLHKDLKHLVWVFDFFGTLGVFLIYLLAFERFWSVVLEEYTFLAKLIFALFNIYFISRNLKIFAKFETLLGLSIIIFFVFISLWLAFQVNFSNFYLIFQGSKDFFLPYGVLLFAFSGTSAVPLALDVLGRNKEKFVKVNLISLVLVSLIYLFYALSVLGFLGLNVSETSLESLKPFLPLPLFLAILILVTFNIMLVDLAFYLKRGLIFDYNFSQTKANLILIFSILFLLFISPDSLVKIISVISEIFLGFNLLVLTLIYLKLKEKKYFKFNKALIIFISLVFALGILHGTFK